MKKALIVTTVSGFVPQFEMSNVAILQKMGYEVHYASNFHNPHYGFDNHRLDGTGIIRHQVDFVRSPFWIRKNRKAYKQLKKIMEKISFQIVHCHTPMGGVWGRLVAEEIRKKQKKKKAREKMTVLYTAHGFHFYKGAPIINWLIYYAVEWWLAHDTDILITINQEDYMRAKKFHLRKNGRLYQIDGVGISADTYQNILVDKVRKRKELGVLPEDYLFISVGELTKRKNHQVVIRALARIKKEGIKKVSYLICGEGSERERLIRLIQQNHMEGQIFLLGYREDIKELLAISDCFIFPSKQEGLPVAVMEAMAVGLPCICSDVRGNRDLLKENLGDILVKENRVESYCTAMKKMMKYQKKRTFLQKRYEQRNIEKQMKGIYSDAEAIT